MISSVFTQLIDHFGCAIMDGGLATELEARGYNLNHPLWSSHILALNPSAIEDVHLSYLRCGAKVILTASYQLSFQACQNLEIEETEAVELLNRSVSLALQARERFNNEAEVKPNNQRIIIGGSIGPYGAYLANGAEYTGDYSKSTEELIDFHRKQYEYFDQSKVDFILFETIPSIIEVAAINRLVNEYAKKEVALSLSCRNDHQINDGTKIEMCLDVIRDNANITSIGINCTDPKYGAALVTKLKARAGSKYVMIYPNSGEEYSVDTKTWTGPKTLRNFAHQAMTWKQAGAQLIGGCCRVGPEHISTLSHSLANQNP